MKTPNSSSLDTTSICPLTLQALPKNDPENVAILFGEPHPTKTSLSKSKELLKKRGIKKGSFDFNPQNPCQCTLIPLMSFLQNGSSGVSNCPVCQSHPISSIWNPSALKFVEAKLGENEISGGSSQTDKKWKVIAYRYGKQCYYLYVDSVISESIDPFTKNNSKLAQDWIAHILGMDTELGLKILHKGKVIHPNRSQNSESISSLLLEISKKDICAFKKPSLVVMGTRTGTELIKNPNSNKNTNNSTFGRGTLANIGIGDLFSFVYQMGKRIFGGIFLFVKSIFFQPVANSVDRNERRDD